jgi:hypothetical protein
MISAAFTSTPAHEAGALPRAVGFRPTTLSEAIIIGFLTLMGCGVVIFTVDLSECDLLFPLASWNSILRTGRSHCSGCVVSFRRGAADHGRAAYGIRYVYLVILVHMVRFVMNFGTVWEVIFHKACNDVSISVRAV